MRLARAQGISQRQNTRLSGATGRTPSLAVRRERLGETLVEEAVDV